MRDDPPPPLGVVIVDIVGGRHPVEVKWLGYWDAEGCAVWRVVGDITYPIHRIDVAELPGKTQIQIPSPGRDGRFN